MTPKGLGAIPLSAVLAAGDRDAITEALRTDATLSGEARLLLGDLTSAADDELEARWQQYDAVARAIQSAQVDVQDAGPVLVRLPAPSDLRFVFARVESGGALRAVYELAPQGGSCRAHGVVHEALMRQAIERRALVIEDARSRGTPTDRALPMIPAACATCPAGPSSFRLAMPVLWHGELLGACYVERCGAQAELDAAEPYSLARLAETLAFTEKYRQLRKLRVHEMQEVARKERELQRLTRRLRLATHVACDVAYSLERDSGRLDIVRTGHALPVVPMPEGASAVDWWLSQVHEEDRPHLLATLRRAERTPGATLSVEYRARSVTGGWLHLRHDMVVDVGEAGEDAVHVGALKDISAYVEARRRLAEERMRLEHLVEERTKDLTEVNAELARAAKLKDEFLASMSHELRTPLNAILGISEAIREGVWGELAAEQSSRLAMVHESGSHLLTLINDILDLAKIGAGKLLPEPTFVDVDEVAMASLRLVSQLAMERRIRVEQVLPAEHTTIVSDGRMLKQILLNLLNNAVKFTAPGGSVRLTVRTDEAENAVTFEVSDTGIGIAPDELTRIFRPFVQVQQGLARPYGGTGLGLALVAQLAEVLQGGVHVTSEPGVGSTFTMRLPMRTDAPFDAVSREHAPAAQSTRRAAGAQHTVLLAEDDAANVQTFLGYLTAKGYHVVVAHDGEEALAIARDIRPALILMDIQMPRLDGLEATRRLRADPNFVSTPIIALTALAMPGDRERCIAAGATDYLSKPTTLSELRNRIAAFIGAPDHGVTS